MNSLPELLNDFVFLGIFFLKTQSRQLRSILLTQKRTEGALSLKKLYFLIILNTLLLVILRASLDILTFKCSSKFHDFSFSVFKDDKI